MKEISIRDVIIYYTARAQAFKDAAGFVTVGKSPRETLEKQAELLSDIAYDISRIPLSLGKSSTTEADILEHFYHNNSANQEVEK